MRAKSVSSIAELSGEMPPPCDAGQIISEAAHWSNILSSSLFSCINACGNAASAFSNWLLLKQFPDRVMVADFSARWIKTITSVSIAMFSLQSMF
ncbi:hypothetical protein QD336_04660 [Rhizobium sp. BR 250]